MEQALISIKATVMLFEEGTKKWVPAGPPASAVGDGSSQAIVPARVQIFMNPGAGTYRIVGRRGAPDHSVVLNCPVLRSLKYNQATPTFHQWRDQKQVYGLYFGSPADADAFASTMRHCLDALLAAHRQRTQAAPAPPAPIDPRTADEMHNALLGSGPHYAVADFNAQQQPDYNAYYAVANLNYPGAQRTLIHSDFSNICGVLSTCRLVSCPAD